MRDLEHEVAQLKAKLGAIKKGQPLVSLAPPAPLPVEVREPEAEPVREDGAIVAGYDEDGSEILYVGEAARGETYVPSIELSGTGSRARRLERPAPRRAKRRKSLPPVPVATERLDVMKGAGPRVKAISETAVRAPVAPSSVGARYNSSLAQLKGGLYDVAVTGFRKLVATSPKSDFADNAQYWIGEAFYAQRNYATAVAEFHKVIQNYPRGNKVAAAKLKIAYCHVALGHTETARELLQKLVREHPSSSPAKLAAGRLKTL